MCAYMCVVKEVDIHENLSKSKNGKHTNFVVIMNVFLLAMSFPMFGCCVAEAIHG